MRLLNFGGVLMHYNIINRGHSGSEVLIGYVVRFCAVVSAPSNLFSCIVFVYLNNMGKHRFISLQEVGLRKETLKPHSFRLVASPTLSSKIF
jgi:hypothetical protein